MPSLNKVVLIGRLTRDPELRYTNAGLAVASFSIAVDRVAKNQDGSKKTDFFRCNAWRQKADFVGNYCKKGRLVAVDGRIELNKYTDKDGVEKLSVDIVCDSVELLDSAKNQEGGERSDGAYGGHGNDGTYFGDEEPVQRQASPQQAAPPQRPPAPRPVPPPVAGRPAPPRPIVDLDDPSDDDYDDSDPFADE